VTTQSASEAQVVSPTWRGRATAGSVDTSVDGAALGSVDGVALGDSRLADAGDTAEAAESDRSIAAGTARVTCPGEEAGASAVGATRALAQPMSSMSAAAGAAW
jgi:hypothetical protein